MKRVCLLTGPPRSGKTSLIKEVIGEFKGKAGGFYTEEIRENNERRGFRLVTLDGKDTVLSHVDFKSPYHVGKYGVNISGLEEVGVSTLLNAVSEAELIIVDEIGRMEMFSLSFRDSVSRLIDSGRKVLGTILLHHHTWSDIVKARPEVQVIMLNRNNRSQVLDTVKEWLKETE